MPLIATELRVIADANTLDQVGGYDFPHGIDINDGMIALMAITASESDCSESA